MYSPAPRHLWNRWLDILLLGGASLIALPLLALTSQDKDIAGTLIGLSFLAAIFINHPHFAHSYLILYRQIWTAFNEKQSISRTMKIKYAWAGGISPLLLFLFLAYPIYQKNWQILGLAANLMFLLVGWHYAKQGFGMLMLDAALKSSFFNHRQRQALLTNAYLCWALAWIKANLYLRTGKFLGISYYTFPIPNWVESAFSAAVVISTAIVCWHVMAKLKSTPRQRWPIAGLTGYTASLYPWLLLANPYLSFFIPAFHSLQYLAVTARLEKNRSSTNQKVSPPIRLALISSICIGLGVAGFDIIPNAIDTHLSSAEEGISLGIFSCWIFINVHHYIIDNVIWKKENPETHHHLFQVPATGR